MTVTLMATIFVFGMLVLFHELGHFITAKLVGMRVDEFAIGFGSRLISKKYGETEYSLRLIPLGGFNRIAGMDPDEEKDERSYSAKPIWARMIVILAGSIMNFVLPVILFFLIFAVSGVNTPSTQPIVGEVLAGKPAALAGLTHGDRIVEIDGEKIANWNDFVKLVRVSDGRVLDVAYERGGELRRTSMIPQYDEKNKRAVVGVISAVDKYHPGVGEAAGMAVKNTFIIAKRMVEGLVMMLTGTAAADVSGPLGVAQMAGEVAQMGMIPLLQFAAFLSINLGIINLLPIPALDGGHFFSLLLEALRGKPLGEKSVRYAQMVGITILMCIMLFATFKDLLRLKLFG